MIHLRKNEPLETQELIKFIHKSKIISIKLFFVFFYELIENYEWKKLIFLCFGCYTRERWFLENYWGVDVMIW